MSFAQSKLNLQTGITISRIRAVYDPSVRKGTSFGDFSNFIPYYHPFLGVEYEYVHNKIRISTGVAFTAFGSGNTPLFGNIPWPTFYWLIPVLGGYVIPCTKDVRLLLEGGIDIGLQQGESGIFYEGTRWGNINAVVGIKLQYRRFHLGIRGHWGLTNFRYFPPITYKHTALTTYLGYTLWYQAKSKARRLKKQQEKQLE